MINAGQLLVIFRRKIINKTEIRQLCVRIVSEHAIAIVQRFLLRVSPIIPESTTTTTVMIDIEDITPKMMIIISAKKLDLVLLLLIYRQDTIAKIKMRRISTNEEMKSIDEEDLFFQHFFLRLLCRSIKTIIITNKEGCNRIIIKIIIEVNFIARLLRA
jgi:hypothetical protein